MSEEQPGLTVMHNEEGVILQVPTGQNLYCIIGLSDQILEQIYEERKKRKQERLKIIKPGILTLRD